MVIGLHWLDAQNLRFCDFLNVVGFGYYELWWPLISNSIFETSLMLWNLATRNYGGLCLQKIVVQKSLHDIGHIIGKR